MTRLATLSRGNSSSFIRNQNIFFVTCAEMADAAFSEDGKYYSIISDDGRLKIWDTETNVLKQEYTPDLHLKSPPKCLQWINLSQTAGSYVTLPKNNAKQKLLHCIALGTAVGKILIYVVAEAKVESVLEDAKCENQRKSIVSIDWNRRDGLYTCNAENIVCEWDIQGACVRNKYNVNVDSTSKHTDSISAIKLIPHTQNTPAKYLVTASYQARLWRLHNGTVDLLKTLGHSTTPKAVLYVASLDNKSWLIEGSQTERLLSFWDVTVTSDHMPQMNGDDGSPRKRKKRKSMSECINTPAYNFVLEDAPRLIDVHVENNDGTKVVLAAVTKSGVLHYYDHLLNGSSLKPIKPTVTIQVATSDANPLPLQCCRLSPHGDMLIGYTNETSIQFERTTPDLKSKTQIIIRGGKSKKKTQSNDAKSAIPHTTPRVKYVESIGEVPRKRVAPGTSVEAPMEERLSNLTINLKNSRSAVNQNMSRLLVQGLQSMDQNILRMVLMRDDRGTASLTINNLPPQYVPQLLEQLAEMSTKKTNVCAAMCVWVSAAVERHAALILSSPDSRATRALASILATFVNRRSHLCQLLNLKGRLDLTTVTRDRAGQEDEQQAVLEYNDTSEEEMEIDGYHSEHSEEHCWSNAASDAEEDAEENSAEE